MKATYPLSRFVVFATTYCIFALASGAPADSAGLSEKSSWLLGKFTQNAPCKGDGTDPAELKVRIAADQIESKSGICNFLSVTPEPNRLKANMECHFPARPLIWRCHVYAEGQRHHRCCGPRQQLYRHPLSMPEVTAAPRVL